MSSILAHSKDDIAISSRPFRQVDYLSHDWKEDDILLSWRCVVMGRGALVDQVRLENAAWRTWAKVRNSLKTVPPESLNWRKECDTTWLYGPLHSTQNPFGFIQPDLYPVPSGNTCIHGDFRNKTILKRRSMSEEMLHRSLPAASLLNQTVPDVNVQNITSFCSPLLGHSPSRNLSERVPKRPQSRESHSRGRVSYSPGTKSPSHGPKRTRFNERVEQCIILGDDNKPDNSYYCSNSDSDDGILIQCTNSRPVSRQKVSQLKLYKGKGISMLPSTSLKLGQDSREPCKVDCQEFHYPLMPFHSPQDTSSAEQPMAASVGTGGANGSLEDVSLDPAIARSSQSSQAAAGDLYRTTCSDSRFQERIGSGQYGPFQEGRVSFEGGIASLVGEAITSFRDVTYVIWNATRKGQ